MDGAFQSPRAQELASRVWHLPHVRLAIFEELCVLSGLNDPVNHLRRRRFLRQFIALNRETSLDVALLLYRCLEFAEFPWNCEDLDRSRAYAAGVRSLTSEVEQPYDQLDLEGTFDVFPNLTHFSTPYLKLILDRNATSSSPWEAETVDDGAVSSLKPPYAESRQLAELKCIKSIAVYARPSTVAWGRFVTHIDLPPAGDGFEVPTLLLTPLRELHIHSDDPEWFHLLAHRKHNGIPIKWLVWRLGVVGVEEEDIGAQLAQTIPPGLTFLQLHLFSFIPRSVTLDGMMAPLDVHVCPDLEHLVLHLCFYQSVEVGPATPYCPDYDWGDLVFPPGLHVQLNLVICDHVDDASSNAGFFEEQLLGALPLAWMMKAKPKLDEVGGSLSVETYRQKDHVSELFNPPAVVILLSQILDG